jgi:hypothetical protein
VGEHHIRLEFARDLLEGILDCRELGRKVSVLELVQAKSVAGRRPEEFPGAKPRLGGTRTDGAPDDPPELRARTRPGQLQDRSAAADFDVIRVCTKAENPQPASGCRALQFQQWELLVRALS